MATPRKDRSDIVALLPAVITRYAAGETLKAILDSNPALPNIHVLRKIIAADADLCKRFASAILSHRRVKWIYSEADFDRALERIATTIEPVLRRHPGEPAYSSLQGRARREEAFRLKLEAANQRRRKLEGARQIYREEDYQRIVAVLEEKPRSIAAAARVVAGPSEDAFLGWLSRRPEERARVDAVAIKLKQERLQSAVDRKQPRPEGRLQSALTANALYAAATRATPRNLDEAADDVRSEIVLDLLEGRITMDDLRSRSREIVGIALKRNRSLSLSAFVSLDDDVSIFDERMARVDTLTTADMVAY